MLVEENVIPVTDSTTATESGTPTHYGTESGHFETLNLTLSHEQGSERSERASERVSAAQGASKANSPKQANE